MSERRTTEEMYDEDVDWEATEAITEPVVIKRPLDKVIPVRLSADLWEQLRAHAAAKGIGPTTLARMWLIERLRLPDSGGPQAPAQPAAPPSAAARRRT